jgi:glycosyltransferase involved in cell wall biosynthesis
MRIAFLTTDNREQFSDYDNPQPHFGPAPEALLEGLAGLTDRVEVHVISCTRRKMHAPGKLAANIWFHQPVVPKFAWGRMAFIGCGIAVRRVLQELQPDLVHAQGTERDCAVSMMMGGFPSVLTIHGHMARIAELTGARFPGFYWMARHLEAMAIRRANGVVCITNYTRDRVTAAARRTWVVPNAVHAGFFEVNSQATGKQILCVAHVCPWKRQVELIEALDGMKPGNRPELVFLGHAGADDYSRRFLSLVAERDWCFHAGRVSRTELHQWMKIAAGLILPSIEDNCPMVILEAMAAGLPVAGAAIGGVPDLIKHGDTGLLFDPYDPMEIRSSIERLVSRSSERQTFASRAREVALSHFHPQVIATEHLRIYCAVMNGMKDDGIEPTPEQPYRVQEH